MANVDTHKVIVSEFESQISESSFTELDDSELQSVSGGGCFGIGYQFNSNSGCVGIGWS